MEVFLNGSEKGAIYFSLGSNVKVRDLPIETFNILLEIFAELPFRLVWKVETTDLIKNMSNIYTGNWLPQQEILCMYYQIICFKDLSLLFSDSDIN